MSIILLYKCLFHVIRLKIDLFIAFIKTYIMPVYLYIRGFFAEGLSNIVQGAFSLGEISLLHLLIIGVQKVCCV